MGGAWRLCSVLFKIESCELAVQFTSTLIVSHCCRLFGFKQSYMLAAFVAANLRAPFTCRLVPRDTLVASPPSRLIVLILTRRGVPQIGTLTIEAVVVPVIDSRPVEAHKKSMQ